MYSKSKPGSTSTGSMLGIALVAVFLLVTVVFIIIYSVSATPDETNVPENIISGSVTSPGDLEGFNELDLQHNAGTGSSDFAGLNEAPDNNVPVIEITGTAYLTFDDGPSRTLTPGILDILAEEGIKATFFILPREGADDIFERIIDEGHEIGNHTYSHDYTALFRGNVSAFKDDVLKASRFLSDRFGYAASSFRFPGGSMTWKRDIRNPRINVLNEIGYTYYDWDIDSGDALQADKGAEAIIENVLDNTNGKEHVIILLHDYYTRETTLEALPMIIKGLREQGYEFDVIRKYPG